LSWVLSIKNVQFTDFIGHFSFYQICLSIQIDSEFWVLDVEAEVYYIAVLNRIFLSFDGHSAGFFHGLF
jgi:hypothetical protein